MLVRASRRNTRLEALRTSLSSSRLSLSSRCLLQDTRQQARIRWVHISNGPQGPGLAKRRSSKDASGLLPRRALATAVGHRSHDDIPFESLSNAPSPNPLSSLSDYGDLRSLSSIRPFDPTSPLYLGGSVSTAPERHNASKLGIGGDIYEMRSVFEACLQVGRVERAGAILRRINKLGYDNARLLKLHNAYLRCAMEQIILNPTKSASQAIHQWFELEFIKYNLRPNAETVAYMVKASIQSESGRRERLVRRYMDMVSEDTGYEVLCSNILTAQEVNLVTHICPTFNLTEGEEVFLDDEVDLRQEDIFEAQQTDIDTPELSVRSTQQKGLGLKALKQSLSIFSDFPREGIDMRNASLEEKRMIQKQLEEDAVSSAIDRWREESSHLTKMGLNTSLQTKSLGARMWRWQLALQEFIKEELVRVEEAEQAEKRSTLDSERCSYGPFLRLCSPEKLAAVTILSVMTTFGAQGVDKGLPLASAILAIAHHAEDECAFQVLQQKSKKKNIWPSSENGSSKFQPASSALLKQMAKSRQPGSAARLVAELSTAQNTDFETPIREWPSSVRAKVGACLMSALIETAKVPVSLKHPESGEVVMQMQPAFVHSHQYRLGRKLGVVTANKVLISQLKREPVHSLLAKHLPMLVQPDPWTHFNKGGFISHPSKVLRVKLGDRDQRHYAEAAIGHGDMQQTFKGLDVLGKQSWQINQPVFDVMLEAWNSGEAIANIPDETPKFAIPPEPEPSKGPLERRKWIQEVKRIENLKGGLHSQRCFQNFQLEIARALKNEVFYFPHNVDFRGRAYPIPPYLNHMGADHCRGLLKFGNGKALGTGGLKWLKIHLANVYGFDKASLSEREHFADTNLEKIYDSATKPLSGNKWWLDAEDPWQCLAACFEVRNALESGSPEAFISYLPIHQDGTCNGLQHYAALGGDSWGAKQVNLEPGDRPADVYTAVADLVRASIAKDKARGNPYAIEIDGKITRKTVKQTVMTNVYGVTFVGARAQVRKQLVAARHVFPNTDAMNVGLLSSYVATKIFTALSTMFKGAHDIQYWLGECASRITASLTPEQLDRIETEQPRLSSNLKTVGSHGRRADATFYDIMQFKSSVIWTTPLHMPVVQPYRKSKSRVVLTHMQQISLSEPHRSHPVNRRKQLQAFPPNFVHSLDATHMLLSALKCDEMGLSFAAVHDSFWTHAADVDTMNEVLRDSFIRIHIEDVVGRLAVEFSSRYKNHMYQATIRTDTLLYQKIEAWRSSGQAPPSKWKQPASTATKQHLPRLNELMLERERVMLLNSNDPEEVARGKAMVTPASIFEEMTAGQDLAPAAELREMGLGDISSRAALSLDQEIEVGDEANIQDIEDPLPGGTQEDIEMECDHSENPKRNVNYEKGSDNYEAPQRRFDTVVGQMPRYATSRTKQIWLPLTFPPVPKKGQFDVSRLKESQYFFS